MCPVVRLGRLPEVTDGDGPEAVAELLAPHYAPAKDIVVRRRARDDRRRVEYALSERIVLRFGYGPSRLEHLPGEAV